VRGSGERASCWASQWLMLRVDEEEEIDVGCFGRCCLLGCMELAGGRARVSLSYSRLLPVKMCRVGAREGRE
jgi:hypothetical protein